MYALSPSEGEKNGPRAGRCSGHGHTQLLTAPTRGERPAVHRSRGAGARRRHTTVRQDAPTPASASEVGPLRTRSRRGRPRHAPDREAPGHRSTGPPAVEPHAAPLPTICATSGSGRSRTPNTSRQTVNRTTSPPNPAQPRARRDQRSAIRSHRAAPPSSLFAPSGLVPAAGPALGEFPPLGPEPPPPKRALWHTRTAPG